MNKTLATVIVSTILGGFFGSYLSGNYASQLPWNNSYGLGIQQKFIAQNSDDSTTLREEKNREEAIINVVDRVVPSVVSIAIEKDVTQNFQVDPFFNGWPFFYNIPQQQPQNQEPDWQKVGGGTGFIISSDGYILTNKHVVADNDARYKVTLNNGTEYDAKLVGTDLFNDIGALKIEAKDLPTLELGNSDNLVIGQTVIAIGNALAEFSNTVTTGVVSGIGRSIVASSSQGSSEKLEDVIQTDAAINPGNSGGPLLNLDGQVIGINTAVSNQGQLIGFAIPINSAKSIIKSVTESGEIIRPYLGVRYIMLSADIAKANNLEIDYGALIIRGDDQTQLAVVPGSPADKAGILENDIILEVNGQKLSEDYPLAKAVSQYSPGQEIKLKIWSKGQEKEIKVNLEKYNS
ncbi:trypsin-like peptidase domain-containing protein [Patescibacteria group bacterium]|nr:trypsin-like peptidase domain-containing protein [Patescibacteria group bacterium]